jgi:peptidyl-prolyl cis-trans isomerase D
VNKFTSFIGAAAVIAIAVVFILQFQAASPTRVRSDSGPNCAVEVHGACAVSASDFWAAYRLIAWNADPARLKAMGLRRKVADGLLEQWLLNEDAKRLGVGASEDDLTNELGHGRARVSLAAADINSLSYYLGLPPESMRPIPVKGKNKKYDQKVYDKQVRQLTKLSTVDFRAYQKQELVAARMRELIRTRVRVSESEAFDAWAQEKSTVTVDYARFDRRFFADLVVDLSQKSIDEWAAAHKDDIDKVWDARKPQILPECRSVREVMIKLDAQAATDEEKAKAKAKIDRAKERIAKGEDFADVARAMSDSPTAHRGGLVGCLLKGKAPKPLEDAANALAAGKVSDVVSTESGLYLIKMDEIAKDAEAEKLGRAQTVRELYVGQEAERLAVEAAKKVGAAVKGGKPLKDAIDQLMAELKEKAPAAAEKKDKKKDEKKGDKKDEKKAEPNPEDRAPLTLDNHPYRPTLETTLPFTANGDPIPGVRAIGDVSKAAFALDKPGDTSGEPVAFEDGQIIFALKEKSPASKEAWEKDRVTYLAALRANKANDALIAYVKRLQGLLAADAKYTKDLVEEPKGKPGEAPSAPMDDGE